MLSPKQQTTLIEALQQHVKGLRAVYLFGSRASDPKYVTAESDYDIAYDADFPKVLTSKGKLELLAAVMDALGSDYVDLVDLRDSLGHVFRMSIIDGRRIWVREMSETYEREAKWITIANDFKISERSLAQAQITELKSRVKP